MSLAVVGVVFAAAALVVLLASTSLITSLPWRTTPVSVVASLAVGAVIVLCLRSMRGTGGATEPPGGAVPATWALLVPAGCLLLLVVTLHYFDSMAREDGPVEWIGALATGCGCVWALMAARRSVGFVRASLVASAGVLFFLTGEELSWLQRLGQFGTPDALAGNVQGEANLHNLATDRVQALYYLGTSAALVLLPFVARWTAVVPDRCRLLVPGPSVVVLAATSVAFAYARTGNVVHHVAVWCAAGVLLWWARSPRPAWVLLALAVVVGGTVLFAVVGPELERGWSPDEYREMLLGLALAVWAREVLVRSRVGGPNDGVSPGSGDLLRRR